MNAREGLIGELLRRVNTRKVNQYQPYPWQKEAHDRGIDSPERMLMAANGVGKSIWGGAETGFHMTGLYPDWWGGRRFDHPVKAWIGSISNEFQKDTTQAILLGNDIGESYGTGMVPLDRLVGRPKIRQAGVGDVVDMFQVRHVSGGISWGQFKTYKQGWRMWMGAAPDLGWLDEQPDEASIDEGMIFSELRTRIFRSKGLLYVTMTPLLGETDMTRHFQSGAQGIWYGGATWDDAPHLDEGEKQRLRATYPAWELEVRTKGIPMMGSGKVITVSEDSWLCEPFQLPKHFRRIVGIDFGVDHPFAAVWLAYDADKDVIYVTDCFKVTDEKPLYHAEAIKRRGGWIPVSWPHDGLQRGKADGQELYRHYQRHGLKLLSMSARYENDTGGGQPAEPAILDMTERMKSGGFKVFNSCRDWVDESRSYHRDQNGKIVARRDDMMKATQYAQMMLRYAAPEVSRETSFDPVGGAPILRGW